MNGPLGFLALKNRYVIDGELHPEGAMHIGSGLGDADTDATFLSDSLGPLIPGSSLRGVLRSGIERIIQAIDPDRGCVLFAEKSHPRCFTVNRLLQQDFEKQYPRAADREAALSMKIIEGDGLCDICKLFGSQVLASRLRISDCRPISQARLVKRDGVGI